jgi:hypothetical protein
LCSGKVSSTLIFNQTIFIKFRFRAA